MSITKFDISNHDIVHHKLELVMINDLVNCRVSVKLTSFDSIDSLLL